MPRTDGAAATRAQPEYFNRLPADVFRSTAYSRTYYWSRPNGTRGCHVAEALCQGLWPQGAWQQVTLSSKQQQLDLESYYVPLGVDGWVESC